MLRSLLLAPLATLALVGPALADAASAWQGYRAGHYAEALKELTPLAQAGNAEAEFYLGSLCMDGLAVTRDPATAAKWYEAAASRGYLPAEFSLGFLYLNGADGFDADPAKAAPWLTRAAEAGYGPAEALLAEMYRTGNGVAVDRTQAMRWALTAARQGIPAAEFSAGMLEYEEPGVAAHLEAYKWFELAARAGYPGAAESRDAVSRALSPPEIAEAKGRADAFKPEAGG
jgi:localization factor PodJL